MPYLSDEEIARRGSLSMYTDQPYTVVEVPEWMFRVGLAIMTFTAVFNVTMMVLS